MISRVQVKELIAIYASAWEQQDSALILSIFQVNAKYHERVLEQPYVGHSEIKKYWDNKVVSSQANIIFHLLNLYIDGETAIVEWEVSFDDVKQGVRKHMIEVAILEFEDGLISNLREYWHCKIKG